LKSCGFQIYALQSCPPHFSLINMKQLFPLDQFAAESCDLQMLIDGVKIETRNKRYEAAHRLRRTYRAWKSGPMTIREQKGSHAIVARKQC